MLPLLLLPALAADWPDLSKAPSGSGTLSNDVALVIAIEDYWKLPDVPGARANGEAWTAYFRSRGIGMVKTVYDEEATREEMLSAAEVVRGRRREGGNAWVVYVGHGSPGDGTGALVGADASNTASSLENRALPQSALVDALGAKDGLPVVAVIDACFSGTSAAGRLTGEALQPVRPVTVKAQTATVLVAARGDQYAGPLPGLGRPAFSWLLLGAMRGWGDGNGDGTVSAQEALDWTSDRIAEHVTTRRQEPSGAGELSRHLARGAEPAPDLAALVGDARSASAPVPAPVANTPAPAPAAPASPVTATTRPTASTTTAAAAKGDGSAGPVSAVDTWLKSSAAGFGSAVEGFTSSVAGDDAPADDAPAEDDLVDTGVPARAGGSTFSDRYVGMSAPSLTPGAGQAMACFARPTMVGYALPLSVWDCNREVLSLGVGEYNCVPLTPGQHQLGATAPLTPNGPAATASVNAGEVRYYFVGFSAVATQVVEVSQADFSQVAQ